MKLSSLLKATSAFGLASLTSASFFAIDAHAFSMFTSFPGTGSSLSLKQNQSVRVLIPIRSGLEYSRLQQNYKCKNSRNAKRCLRISLRL